MTFHFQDVTISILVERLLPLEICQGFQLKPKFQKVTCTPFV